VSRPASVERSSAVRADGRDDEPDPGELALAPPDGASGPTQSMVVKVFSATLRFFSASSAVMF